MVIADFSGDYVNAENTAENDILTICGPSEYVGIEKDGKKRLVLNVPVSINGLNKTYSPSKETGKKMVSAWGVETSDWIGKKLTAKHVEYESFGETKTGIECVPLI
jgi:hypothetical protein